MGISRPIFTHSSRDKQIILKLQAGTIVSMNEHTHT